MSVKLTVLKNGPIMLEGTTSMLDGNGKEYGLAGKEKLFLCRCGHSSKKPFCDGQHKSKGFEDACEAFNFPTE